MALVWRSGNMKGIFCRGHGRSNNTFMETPGWKRTVREWWGPAVTFLLASILSLSQKQSPIFVNLLLTACTLWTWLLILTLNWWRSASGWKQVIRIVAPLPVL